MENQSFNVLLNILSLIGYKFFDTLKLYRNCHKKSITLATAAVRHGRPNRNLNPFGWTLYSRLGNLQIRT